jgi:hypothetical protein
MKRTLLLAVVVAAISTASANAVPRNVIQYARQLAAQHGWVGEEWTDLDAIVRPESGWDPCAVYPSQHDCGYTGSNSCGIPQANPCPSEWLGRLDRTWKAQVRWLMSYLAGRYHDPAHALAFREANGSY